MRIIHWSWFTALTSWSGRDNGEGSRVLLSDVAVVSDNQEKAEPLNRINGKPGIGIQLFKTNDANAGET